RSRTDLALKEQAEVMALGPDSALRLVPPFQADLVTKERKINKTATRRGYLVVVAQRLQAESPARQIDGRPGAPPHERVAPGRPVTPTGSQFFLSLLGGGQFRRPPVGRLQLGLLAGRQLAQLLVHLLVGDELEDQVAILRMPAAVAKAAKRARPLPDHPALQ